MVQGAAATTVFGKAEPLQGLLLAAAEPGHQSDIPLGLIPVIITTALGEASNQSYVTHGHR